MWLTQGAILTCAGRGRPSGRWNLSMGSLELRLLMAATQPPPAFPPSSQNCPCISQDPSHPTRYYSRLRSWHQLEKPYRGGWALTQGQERQIPYSEETSAKAPQLLLQGYVGLGCSAGAGAAAELTHSLEHRQAPWACPPAPVLRAFQRGA